MNQQITYFVVKKFSLFEATGENILAQKFKL